MTKSISAPVSNENRLLRSLRRGFALATLLLAVGLLAGGCQSMRRGGGGPQGLEGMWTATLNPETIPINVPLSLNRGENGLLTGSLGSAAIEEGRFSGESNGSTIEFQTGAITVEGPTGPITREGPFMWNATLRDGMLDGTVTDSEGRSARWSAQRDVAAAAPVSEPATCRIRRSTFVRG